MSSPFSDFLFTNYAPTANESQKILEFCSQPAAELAQLNGKIMELQRALEVLICKRDEFEKILDTHLALLSPMRHIPTEILQKIFVHCLHTTRNSVMHHSEAPLLLGRVCSRWRQVAMGTAELWSSIHIVLPRLESPEDAPRLNVDSVVTWLQRSGDLPLHISLYEPHVMSSFLPSIIPFAGRWQHVELEMQHAALNALKGLESKDVPLLQTFAFRDSEIIGEPEIVNYGRLHHESLSFMQAAPSLSAASLQTSSSSPIIKTVALPYHQLTSVHINNEGASWGGEALLRLLAGTSSRLQRCSLVYTGEPDTSRPLIFPCLHSLSLQASGRPYDDDRYSILESLMVPSLRELAVSENDGDRVIPAITRLILRTSCSLTKLGLLGEAGVDGAEMIACFRLMPELQELAMNFIANSNESTEAILDALAVPTSGQSAFAQTSDQLCRALRKVTFRNLQPQNLPTFLVFLRSRSTPPLGIASLEVARFYFQWPLWPREHADLEGVVGKTGLKLINDGPPPHQPQTNWWTGLHGERSDTYSFYDSFLTVSY